MPISRLSQFLQTDCILRMNTFEETVLHHVQGSLKRPALRRVALKDEYELPVLSARCCHHFFPLLLPTAIKMQVICYLHGFDISISFATSAVLSHF